MRPETYNQDMQHQIRALIVAVLTIASGACAQPAAQSNASDAALELVKQGRKLESDGKLKEALAVYRQAAEKDPALFDAHLAMGRVLDMEGLYAEAHQHLLKAIELAPDEAQNQALSTMAVSHAFQGNAAEAAKYYQKVFERQSQAGQLDGAAGTANALGRVYLETGDIANAEKWYRTGYETAKKIEKLPPDQIDLWEMRWHHAQGRIAARRKQFDAASKHVDEVKTIVGRGTLDEAQQANYPYLEGYVAFYQGNYDTAVAELSKGDQQDPFVLSLLAQSYEQKKDQAKARELYAKILELPGHSLQVALSRPLAQRRVQGGSVR
jgi:tetratricopeptide (TPR) repeat protein